MIPDTAERVVRHACLASVFLQGRHLRAGGRSGKGSSRPQANVFEAPRNALTLASTASSPANVTIALAPLIEAGREG